MEKLCLFVILAILSHDALGISYRYKQQEVDEDSSLEDDSQEEYVWNGPINPNQDQSRNQFPNSNQNRGQTPATTTTANPNVNGGNPANLRDCRRTCPVTSEYNPVCGTNNVSYNNPSRLACDQACGVSVTLLRTSKCPPATPAPAS